MSGMVYFKGVKHINVYLTLVFRASAACGRCSVGVEKMPDRCAPEGSRFARLYFDKVKSCKEWLRHAILIRSKDSYHSKGGIPLFRWPAPRNHPMPCIYTDLSKN